MMQRTTSRTNSLSLSLLPVSLSLFLSSSFHKNKPGVHLAFPPPSTCHLRDEGMTESEREEERIGDERRKFPEEETGVQTFLGCEL